MTTARTIKWAIQGGIVLGAVAALALACFFHHQYANARWLVRPAEQTPQAVHDWAWLCCYAILALALISAVTKKWVAFAICLIVFAVGFWIVDVTY
jgi:hypothetical protein